MNNLRKMFYLLLIIPVLFLHTGCSDDDSTEPEVINEAEVLVQYLEANGDFINTSAPALIKASDVNNWVTGATTDKYYVIDIRTAADFAAGHIPGAVNVSASDIVTHVEGINASSFDKIVVACYSGQTAGYCTSLLRLLGYGNVYDLKWGMTSWNSSLDKWSSNIGDSRAADLVTASTAKAAAGNLPTIATGETSAAEILKKRVAACISEGGFNAAKISNSDVFANPSNYYIVNYWTINDYGTGHIPGAVQYTPNADLKFSTYLNTLPTNKKIVVYCYTGQTSAHVAAYLRVLGYDAVSLLYGVNAMSHTAMPGTKFNAATEVHDYTLAQ